MTFRHPFFSYAASPWFICNYKTTPCVDSRSREYLRLNKNILIALAASITISAAVAQALAQQHDYLNTIYTLIADYIVYFSVFGGLFYLDNRKKYRLDSGETDNARLRHDLIKIIISLGVGEVIYTIARGFSQYYLLTIGHDPYLASIIAQGLSTIVYVIIINLSVTITRLFRDDH